MDNHPDIVAAPYHDARALPAPPIALWLFAALLAASVILAAILA